MTTRADVVTIYRAHDGWRWRYTTPNGRILADSGQGYTRRIDCINGAMRVTATPLAPRHWYTSTRAYVHFRGGRGIEVVIAPGSPHNPDCDDPDRCHYCPMCGCCDYDPRPACRCVSATCGCHLDKDRL